MYFSISDGGVTGRSDNSETHIEKRIWNAIEGSPEASGPRFANPVSQDLVSKPSGNRTQCYVLYKFRIDAHRFGNQHEVFCRHPEMTEAKGCTPTGLILDEG